MQTIYYILSFLAGGVITYFYAKSIFGSKDNTQKVLDLESQIKSLQLEKTDLVVKTAKAEERVLSMNKAYEDLKISMSSMGKPIKRSLKMLLMSY